MKLPIICTKKINLSKHRSMKTKRSIPHLLLSLLVLFTACSKDFLEEIDPNNPAVEQFWRNEADAKSAIVATYQPLTFGSRWNFFECGWGPENWRADDVYYGGEYPSFNQIANFLNTPDIWEIEILFRNNYLFVNRANQAIEGIPLCTMNTQLQEEMIAEARFLRAYGYFNLLRNFRHIPFHPKSPKGEDIYAAQAPRETVWKLIEEDLTEAMAKLPLSRSGADLGRVTKATAAAYLGYSYLFQQKYDLAKNVLSRIYTGELGSYSLLPTNQYAQNFNGYNENNQESIWEVQFSKTTNWSTVNVFTAEFLSWEEANASQWIFQAFMKEKDQDDQIDPRYYVSLISPEANFSTAYGPYWSQSGHNLILKHTTFPWAGSLDWTNNHPLMRYADVLLMLAEAVNETDGADAALPYINLVRQRANKSDLPTGLSKTAFREKLMHERALELSFESRRWYDLVRWHEAGWINIKDVLTQNGAQGINNFTEKHLYYPIPEKEYNTNPKLDRNLQW